MALTVTYIFILKLSMHTHTFSACCTYCVYQQLINDCFAHGPVSSEASSVSAALVANATFILATRVYVPGRRLAFEECCTVTGLRPYIACWLPLVHKVYCCS